MIHAAMLTAMGLGMLAWRPCRDLEARAPRAAVSMLLLSTAAVWVGSLGLVVEVITDAAGPAGTLVAACGTVLRDLLTGGLGWWQASLLLAWVVLLPGRGLWCVANDVIGSRRLLRRVRKAPAVTPDVEPPAAGAARRPRRLAVLVDDLGTPAVTVGLLNPVVAVDAAFWADADPTERSVVLAHEQSHQRGRHGVVDAATRLLVPGLAPLPFVRHAGDCVRRHLEALADDAAVRRHDPRLVGVTLGQVALAARPGHGLGASGDAVWRVQRLIAPSPTASWRDHAILGASTATMAGTLVLGAVDTAGAVPLLLTPSFCPL